MKYYNFATSVLAVVISTSAPVGLIGSTNNNTTPCVSLYLGNDTTIQSSTYLSIGANSKVCGSVSSGTYTSMGAGATISGDAKSGTYFSMGADSTLIGSYDTGVDKSSLEQAASDKDYMSELQATIFYPETEAKPLVSITTDGTILPPGVYKTATSFSVAAGKTLTLDAQGAQNAVWVFNIAVDLVIGANVIVKMQNDDNGSAQVFWNVEGYATTGALSDVVGNIIANKYVTLGAGAQLPKGSISSLKSYVSLGAHALVGCERRSDRGEASAEDGGKP